MDPNLAAMQNLPGDQQQQLMQAIEQMQVRDSLRMYNSLVERCFRDCVSEFRSKDLNAGEEKCVQSCATKFMKHSARVGIRFGELSSEAESQMQAMMQQQQAGK
ncbi:mitochondrial import inner membrane translocase subunit Tim9 [Chlorella sorokiniana]|uniref:Mitochondrial import inner membrane translocase subunit n=1 Tax=Chlorella sorokiniana TaxID=3076 RepID=A0A2P6TUP8_CHLSO|nr:mitochondrial import inner membrane translocase subunit Tim9 [Chlorella sorokiniana]|eukprot:PRW57797.1 mitochondrial import inner membrane translocase subunit Tim9 [Chlorella sorokiniana]